MNAYERALEALTSIRDMVTTLSGYCSPEMTARIFVIAQRAISLLPRRNCDVGTVDEQVERFEEYCQSILDCKKDCPIGKMIVENESLCDHCQLVWAQMPYEEKRKGEERDYETYLRLKEKFDKNQGEKQ